MPGAREVLERAGAGDADAVAVWESALDALALDLSHTVALLSPEAIVIGGGLSQAGDALFVLSLIHISEPTRLNGESRVAACA